MGGFLGIGNTSYGADRGTQLAGQQEQFNNLRESRNQYDSLYPGAHNLFSAGANNLNSGADFWKGVLSSRPGAAGAMAPEINAVNAQADAKRTAMANFGTARTGGTAGENQQLEAQRKAAVTNAIFGARPQAAQGVAQVGQAQSGAGAQRLQLALQSMGLSDEEANQLVDNAIKSRQVSYGINRGVQNQIGQFAGQMLGV